MEKDRWLEAVSIITEHTPDMSRTSILFMLLLLPYSVVALRGQEAEDEMTPEQFRRYLFSAGLEFTMPEGFIQVPRKENPDLWYAFAVMSPDSAFEIRYSVWPLKQSLSDYEECLKDSNCMMVHPNRIFEGRASANVLNMTGGAGADVVRFPEDAVKEEFGADAGGSAMFAFDCQFGQGYTFGQAIMLHKDDVADVLVTFMSNDIERHRAYLNDLLYTVRFR